MLETILFLSGSAIVSAVMVYGSKLMIINEGLNPKGMQEHKIKTNFEMPLKATSLDYLILANSQLDGQDYKGYDCKHYSKATYELYHELIGKDKREELKEEIRFAGGLMKLKGHFSFLDHFLFLKTRGHAWIDVKVNGEWKPFETTYALPKIKSYKDIKGITEEKLTDDKPRIELHFIKRPLKRYVIIQAGKTKKKIFGYLKE